MATIIANIVVGAIVFGGIGFAGYKTIKEKKEGASCAGGCAGCGKATDSCNK